VHIRRKGEKAVEDNLEKNQNKKEGRRKRVGVKAIGGIVNIIIPKVKKIQSIREKEPGER